jgi:hypothetical protein
MTPPIFKMVKRWSQIKKSRISKKKVMAKRKVGNQIAKIIPNYYFNVLSVNVNCLACFMHASFWLQFALTISYLCSWRFIFLSSTYWVHFSPIFLLLYALFVPMCHCVAFKNTPKVFKYFVVLYIRKFTLIHCGICWQKLWQLVNFYQKLLNQIGSLIFNH